MHLLFYEWMNAQPTMMIIILRTCRNFHYRLDCANYWYCCCLEMCPGSCWKSLSFLGCWSFLLRCSSPFWRSIEERIVMVINWVIVNITFDDDDDCGFSPPVYISSLHRTLSLSRRNFTITKERKWKSCNIQCNNYLGTESEGIFNSSWLVDVVGAFKTGAELWGMNI